MVDFVVLDAIANIPAATSVGSIVVGAKAPSAEYLVCDGESTTAHPSAVAAMGKTFPKTTMLLRYPGFSVSAIVVHGSRFVVFGYSKVATSDDAGATWVERTVPAASWSHAVVTTTGAIVAYSRDGSTMSSSDGGSSWSPRTATATAGAHLVAGANGRVLLITDTGSNSQPIYTTDNNGSSWATRYATNASAAIPSKIHNTGGLLLACGYGWCATSTDNGSTWTERTLPADTQGTGFCVSYTDKLVLTGGRYLALSSDNGATWSTGAQIGDVLPVLRDGKLLAFDGLALHDISQLSATRVLTSMGSATMPSTGLGVCVIQGVLFLFSPEGVYSVADNFSVTLRAPPTTYTPHHKVANSSTAFVCAASDSAVAFSGTVDPSVVQAPLMPDVYVPGDVARLVPHLKYYVKVR